MTRRQIFSLGIVCQCLALFALFVPHVLLLHRGIPAVLQTLPVDPAHVRSFGAVTVHFPFEKGLPGAWYAPAVYIVLESQENVFRRVRFSPSYPHVQQGQICLIAEHTQAGARLLDLRSMQLDRQTRSTLAAASEPTPLFVEILADPESCRASIRRAWVQEDRMSW